MKKLIVLLTAVFTLAFTSLCMAADGGALNKQQAAGEMFMQAFTSQTAAYADVAKGFDASLKEKVNEQVFTQLKKQVKEKFGLMKDSKFYSFQRFDKEDRVTYLANFSKENLVAISLSFAKNNKMTGFALSPLNNQQENTGK